MMDQSPYTGKKHIVLRADRQFVGRTFVIEIDKDPQAYDLLRAIARVYCKTRPELARSLRCLADEVVVQ